MSDIENLNHDFGAFRVVVRPAQSAPSRTDIEKAVARYRDMLGVLHIAPEAAAQLAKTFQESVSPAFEHSEEVTERFAAAMRSVKQQLDTLVDTGTVSRDVACLALHAASLSPCEWMGCAPRKNCVVLLCIFGHACLYLCW
jgi:hypothetical protein